MIENKQKTLLEMLNNNIINLNLPAANKNTALLGMIEMLDQDGRLNDKSAFQEEVLRRERIETTDMGIGVAIPHGKSDAVKQTSVAIARLDQPVQWNTEEEEDLPPIFAIFLLAVNPHDEGITHLELISKIAELLLEEDFIKTLKNTNSTEELIDSIQKQTGE